MANIHVSPLASPSLECLSPAELTNEESGQVEQVTPNQDENENDVFKGETKAFGRKKGFCRLDQIRLDSQISMVGRVFEILSSILDCKQL